MSERVIEIIIVGARGRMGTALIREIMESDDLALAGAVDHSDSPGLGRDAGLLARMPEAGVELSDTLSPRAGQVVVDFSLPQATDHNIAQCRAAKVPFVCGTTGLSEATEAALHDAANEIPVVFAANFSVGVTLLTRLAGVAARALGPGWDAEIVETHHRHKRDSPSGTALRLGHAVAAATDRSLEDSFVHDRTGRTTARLPEEIGIVAMRGGDVVGEHTVNLFGEGERIELTHRARDRAIFARGALRAARWVTDQQPGLYDMADVLGLGLD